MNNGQSFLLYISTDSQILAVANIGKAHLEEGKLSASNVAPIRSKMTDAQFCCFSFMFIILYKWLIVVKIIFIFELS
jgi:hypothetical protein